jgi:outer membrane protein, heavy metal efflux system
MTEQFEKTLVRRIGPLGLVALAVVLVGCTNVAPSATRPPSKALGAEFSAYSAPRSAPSRARAAERREQLVAPVDDLSLRDALALALLRNPNLATFSWETRAKEAEALQAGLIQNPELAVEAENFAGAGDFNGYDSAETTVTLGQLVQLGGKRAKRRRVAELERDLADWDYEIARLNVLTAVTQAFVDALQAERGLSLAEELRRLAQESVDAVSKRVTAGAASPVEKTRAAVALSSAEVAVRRGEAARATARARLVALWGAREIHFERLAGDLQALYEPPEFEALRTRLEKNPDVARWSAELVHRDAVVELEDARRIPNVVLQGGVRHLQENNDSALVFGFSVPFPVFDRNQGSRAAARHRRAKARSEGLAATVSAARDLEVGLQMLQANYDAVVALRGEVLPEAESAFEGVTKGYLRGLFRYVDVLDAQRTLFELRARELSALGDFHRAAAAVERLTGTPLGVTASAPASSETY